MSILSFMTPECLSYKKDSSIHIFYHSYLDYIHLFILHFYPIHVQFIFINGASYKSTFFQMNNQLCQHHNYINHFNDIFVLHVYMDIYL